MNTENYREEISLFAKQTDQWQIEYLSTYEADFIWPLSLSLLHKHTHTPIQWYNEFAEANQENC